MLILCVLAHLRQLLASEETVGHEKFLKKKIMHFFKNITTLGNKLFFLVTKRSL